MKRFFAIFTLVAAALAIAACSDKKKENAEPQGPAVVVTLSESELTLTKDQTAQLTCKAEGLGDGAELFWRSQDAGIVTVKDGLVTPVGGGRTQVIAGWHQYRDTCDVFVDVPLEGIVLNVEERELKLGKTFKMKASGSPEDFTDSWDLKWSSSNPSVATVDEKGVVAGLAEGDAVITATVGSISASATIKVREKISALVQTAANIKGIYFELPRNWVSNQSVLTFECLMRGDAFKGGNGSAVNSLFGVEGYWLLRIGDVAPLADNQLEVAGGSWQTQAKFDAGEWYHLAVVWDYPNRKGYLYLNGELLEEHNISAQARIAGTNSQKCRIGASYLDGSTNNRYFDGAVAEMRVWNVVRTAEEIAEHMYEYDTEELGTAGLLAYWKFNEGEGNTVADHSGNNHPVTSIGGDITWEDVALP